MRGPVAPGKRQGEEDRNGANASEHRALFMLSDNVISDGQIRDIGFDLFRESGLLAQT
jgi:hypothetical protein